VERVLVLISVSKVYHDSDIAKAISKSFSLWTDIKLDSSSKVLIKPNLCSIKSHETGITTDPKIVEELIKYLKSTFNISDISIVESDGTQVLADLAFELLGYRRLSERLNVKLANLSKVPFSIRTFPENSFIKKIKIPDLFQDADFFISVPKIKTHMDCYMTCALKNQYGCNPYWFKKSYHKRLNDAIVDVNTAFKPDMIVVDGFVAMDGRKGPTDGVPLRMNTLIIGRDSVAVDHFVSTLMGINPTKVKYIVEAERRGLGTTKYTTVGVNPDNLKRKFNIKAPKWYNCYGLLQNY
jgi:uncharacterized protein (DUF362 family)